MGTVKDFSVKELEGVATVTPAVDLADIQDVFRNNSTKMIPFFLSLIALIFGSFVFQFFLPPVLLLKGAAILFVPAIYFYGCVSLPFPLMLALTFVTGFLNDLLLGAPGERSRRLPGRCV